MKLIVLSPNLHLIFNDEQRRLLGNAFDSVEYYSVIQPIQEISLLADSSDKIVAIDPDFCGWKITREDIDFMQHVHGICLQTTAFHYIDTIYLKEKGIPVTNLRGFSTNAVAEEAMLMIFALARKLPMVIKDKFTTNFEKFRGMELFGKKIGIIGLGRIGTRIGEMAEGIGMHIQYWSENSRHPTWSYHDLKSLLNTSDVLVFALAKNEETKQLLSDEILKNLNPNALLVTITFLEHSKFIKLVSEGKLAGYACDDHVGDISEFEGNVLPGAELGWCTTECFQRNGIQWVESILNANDGNFPQRVN